MKVAKKHLLKFTKLAAVVWLITQSVTLQAQDEIETKAAHGVPYYSDPALSPDGSQIAFVSGGDIWTVASSGGEARLLVSHPDYESRPIYSPDGRYLAFTSTRSGNGDVYILTFATGQLKRLTYDDGMDEVSAWSPDGKYIYFSTSSHEISSMRDVYRVNTEGGTPMPVSNNRYTNEFFATPSPDGKAIALNAHGIASAQWWRNGRSHLDESEIWLLHTGKTDTYEKITEGGAKELWPMWSNDGGSIYYVSDKSGAANLWMKPLNGTAKKLTEFSKGRVVWPNISYNGKSIVFERDFKICKYDIASGKASAVTINRLGSAAGPGVEHVKLANQFRSLVLSPDGKKVAFTAHGDVFVSSSKDGGDAMRVTSTSANETQLEWSPNSNVLVYISDRDGANHLYEYNFITLIETRLTNQNLDDASPVFSHDGKLIAFVRDGKELLTYHVSNKKESVLAKGYFGRAPFASSGSITFSPDNKWIAFAAYGTKSFKNISIVSATGGDVKPISFLANTFGGDVSWSPDGKYILFNTSQRTEETHVARVDLVPQRPKFREDQFQTMFTEQVVSTPPTPGNPPAAKPVNTNSKSASATDTMFKSSAKPKPAAEPLKIVYEGIRQRLNLLPLGVDVNQTSISKDGNTLLINATVAGQQNLYTYSLDELSREPAVVKQITSTPRFKSDAQFSPDGKEVFYLEQGRIQTVAIDTRIVKPLAVIAELDVDFNKEKLEMFKQAWDAQNKGFYDPNFHGTNWQQVRETYEPLAEGANTPDELRRILSLMVGELNASHSGVSGPTPAAYTTGRTGLYFDADEFERNGKLKITEVVTLSPSAISGDIHEGDYLVAIDGTAITRTTNINQLLENKINRRVVLSISSSANGSDAKKVTVRPVNQATEKGLLYKQWAQQQRDYVAKISGGRLGYVHMYDMSQQSLDQLYLDMDAENQTRDGVVVDIRNNNGGFVNAYALDVLGRKNYITMTARGLPSSPARTQLGQRALDAPTILVTNQHSLSDAEDFSEGYRTLNLGKVVGEPTGGWIIYTGAYQLIDGSSVRLPFIKITDHEGKDMELHPRPVDIAVTRPLGESNENKDSQLDIAVKELLMQIDSNKSKK